VPFPNDNLPTSFEILDEMICLISLQKQSKSLQQLTFEKELFDCIVDVDCLNIYVVVNSLIITSIKCMKNSCVIRLVQSSTKKQAICTKVQQ